MSRAGVFVRILTAAILAGTAAAGCRKPGGEAASGGPKPAPAEPLAEAGEDHHEGLPATVRLTSAAVAEAGIGTWTVKALNLAHLLVLNGTVAHDENRLLEVGANVRGRVVEVRDLGARVAKGDVVATIESIELGRAREELVRELSSLRVARRAYERAKALLEAKAISAGEFQSREGDYLSKKAAADAAERTLHLLGEGQDEVDRVRARVEAGGTSHDPQDGASLALRAPFGGRVIDRKVAPGALFEALQPLLTLADLSNVWVFLQAYEKDLALIKEGVAVTIRTEAYPQEALKGRVDFLGSVVDAATRTVKVRANVKNPGERLRPGMFVKAQVDVPQSYEGGTVLAVPQSALQTLEDRTTVFLQTEPGVFVRRVVETGHSFEGFTELYSGVKEGDVVVTEGSFVVKSEFAKGTLVEHE
ncbi:MAG TPA: efflux RND transporter periplasmic adaptor subunit [Vicinamibacteria bacterium]|nr:efflux RND transporter periplasmic adaptor subunit [Vicinamibacteria bacterium]